jgi:hypothetical protein
MCEQIRFEHLPRALISDKKEIHCCLWLKTFWSKWAQESLFKCGHGARLQITTLINTQKVDRSDHHTFTDLSPVSCISLSIEADTA